MVENLVSRNQFLELCKHRGEGLPYQTLASDIRRGKVIEEDLMINLGNPKNKEYLKIKKDLMRRRASGIEFDLEAERKQIQLKIAQEDLKIKQLKFEKLQGEVIPSKVVRSLVQAYFKQHLMHTKRAVGDLIIEICRSYSIPFEERSVLISDLVKALNNSTSLARTDCLDMVEQIVEESQNGI